MRDIIHRHKTPLSIFIIFIFALLVRVVMLDALPANLHEDEILSGYIGRFILQNGVDVYGNKWPLLYFNKFGDYYIILPFYLSGIGVWLFDNTAFGIRFFGALLGAMAVFPVYLLSKHIFNDKRIALLSAIAIAIMPWHINLSRTTAEGLMGTTIFSIGLFFMLEFIKNKRAPYLFGMGASFIISYFFYHPFRLYVPITLIFVLILYFDRKVVRNNILLAIVALLFVITTAYIGNTQWGSGRFAQTSIFSELSGVSIKVQERIFNEPSILQARIFNNKVLAYSREFLYQYSRYFSPDVLFIKGGNSPRVAIPDQGLQYVIFLPIMLYGLYIMSRKDYGVIDKRNVLFLFFLLFVAPVPAGLTIIDTPNIHRAVFMTVPLSILVGYGLNSILKLGHYRRIVIISVFIILGAEIMIFQHTYAVQSDLYSSVSRNDGQREVVEYVAKNRGKFDRIYLPMEGNFPLYYLFYTNNFDRNIAGKIKTDIEINNIDNVYFTKERCKSGLWKIKQPGKVGFVTLEKCGWLRNYKRIGKIHGVNKLHTYKIYSN